MSRFDVQTRSDWIGVGLIFVGCALFVSGSTPLSPLEAGLGIATAVANVALEGLLGFVAEGAGVVPMFPAGTFGLVTELAAVGQSLEGVVGGIVLAAAGLVLALRRGWG